MTDWAVLPIAMLAAMAFALSARWKHASAGQVPTALSLDGGSVLCLVRASLTHRLWLGGIAADAIGLSLQIIALHLGALSVVQCVLVSGLLFALLLRRGPARVTGSEVGWALALTGSLGGFLVIIGTSSTPVHERADRLSVIVAGCVGVVITLICIAVARQRSARRSGALLGIAVGTMYAATAALLKSVTNIVADHGVLAAVFSWQSLATVVVGAGGLIVSQIAFQTGPLTASLPAIAATDPLLSVSIGLLVFEEQVRGGLGSGAVLIGLLVVLGVSVFKLSAAGPAATAATAPIPDRAPIPSPELSLPSVS